MKTLIIGRTARRQPFCDVVSGAWWAYWAGERVAGPSLETVDDDGLGARTRSATDAVCATVTRLMREDGIHPQLVVLAVARVAGELGADVAQAGGMGAEELLDDLAELVRLAGREPPVAGSA